MVLFVMNNCNPVTANQRISSEKISDKHIELYKYDMSFILRFSNMIYNEENKDIVIPIFQGKYEDVLYKDFIDYCIRNKLLQPKVMETGFMIKTKKGDIRKTFHQFLAFYKSNILKNVDIEKPTVMILSSTDWIIKYDFIVNGVPCYLKIELPPRDEDLKKKRKDLILKSVYDIIPEEEDMEPGFLYDFYIGSKSTD
jgi:hypothetical protein